MSNLILNTIKKKYFRNYFKVIFVIYNMSDDYISGGGRNKKKNKMREKKKNPYKSGGRFRAVNVELTNSVGNVINVKKRDAKKKDKSKKKNKHN